MAAQGQAGGGEAAQAAQGQGEQQQGDPNALQQGLESLTASLDQRLDERFGQFQEQFFGQFQDGGQEEQQGQEEQGFDLSGLEQQFGLDEQGAQEMAQAFESYAQQHTQQAIDKLVNEQLSPLREQLGHLQWNQDASALANEIPELENPETAQQVMDTTHQIAESIGNPALATHPQFVRLAAYGMIGMQLQKERQEAGEQAPNAAQLEGGGGAAPAGQQQNPQDAMFNFERGPGQMGGAVLPHQ